MFCFILIIVAFMKRLLYILILSLLFFSCTTPPSATNNGIRTLILDDISVAENETDNGFTAWELEDYYEGGPTVIEVGYFEKSGIKYGFVLFDGGYTGVLAHFLREGIDYRWDWGSEYQYCITVSPDEKACYYDFSLGTRGEPQRPRALYRAEKR